MDQRRAAQKLPFFFALIMLTTLFAIIIVFLLSVPPSLAASGKPDVTPGVQLDHAPAFTPEAPPEACRDCGVQYYRPSSTPSKATREVPVPTESGAPSNAPSTSGAPASPGPSHLSADRRVNLARALVERNRFAEALEILRALAPDHPDQTDVRFLLGLAAVRGSQTRGLPDEEREALLDEAIAAFRSILIRRPELVRVRLELGLAFYFKEEDNLAREHFERALVGKPPKTLVENVTRLIEGHSGPAPLGRVVRLLHCPGYEHQRRIGRGVHLYQ